MAGVPSLLGQQQMPGPMPGQAQQQPMPGMMPQQSGPSQGIAPNPFKNQKLDELLYLYRNPQLIPEGETYRVITALSEKVKAAQMAQANQGQQAMAQNAQMQQQPPVAEGLAQQAQALMQGQQQQMPQEPVMAAYGGEMQGYAGGGAVAFGQGGNVQYFKNGADEEGVQSSPASRFLSNLMGGVRESLSGDPEADKLRQQIRAQFSREAGLLGVFRSQSDQERQRAQEIMRLLPTMDKEQMRNILEQSQRAPNPVQSTTDTRDEVTRMLGRAPAPVPMAMQDTRGVTPDTVAAARNLGTGQQRPPAAPTAAPAAPMPGLAGLMGPQIDPDRLMARKGQQTIADALERGSKPTAEETLARGGIDALMKDIVDSRRAEEQRLASQGEQRFREAQERYNKPFLQDPMALGELIAGMRGARTFYEGITGAASAGGKAQGAREQALRQAEDKMDLSRKDVYNLSTLRQQVQLDQAKLIEARASGDAQRENNAAIKLGESQQNLAKFEADMSDKAAGRRLQEEGIKVQREQIDSTERIAKLNRQAQAALRNLPGPEQQMVERAIKSLMDANPGMAYHEAYDKARGAGRPDRTVLNYDQAADNVAKFLDTQPGMMEIAAIKRRAKDAGQPEPSNYDIRNMLIQRELQGAGSRFAGQGSSAPTGGVVTPKSQAEFNALPKGARYINPADGKEYIKN